MASQSAEVEGQVQIRTNDSYHLAHSTLNKIDLALTSQVSPVSLESRAEEAVVQYRTVQQEEDGEEDAEDWNNDGREEGSAEWTPSDPSSEEEEDGKRSNSGYMLLPQDADPGSTENGDGSSVHTVEVVLGSLELNTAEIVTPRMSKWLQKQVEEVRQGHCGSEREGANWAKFSDPSPARDSSDWPTSAVHPTVKTLQPTSSTTVEAVKPHTTMEEGMVHVHHL